MDDMISRQALMKEFSDFVRASNNSDFARTPTWNDAVSLVESMPSAQPEIIVCADCKHWICHDRRCGFWNHGVKPLDWCCHAERRTDEAD